MKNGLPRRAWFRRMAAVAGLAAGASLAAEGPAPDAGFTREDSLRLIAQGDSARRQGLDARWAYVKALQLDAGEGDCVAFDPGRGECLLTAGDFNLRVLQGPPFPGADRYVSIGDVPAADLRRKLLQTLLHRDYLRYMLDQDPARDSLDGEWRSLRDRQVAEARRQIGDSTLRVLYEARYERDFRKREERIIQVLATSDSGLADSLGKAYSDTARKGTQGGWTWRKPERSDLPPGILALASTLAKGEVSKPWRAPFGFLLVRWQSVRRRAAIPFEEAIPVLLARSRLRDQDSARSARARESRVAEYYRAHRSEFRSPDTLRFRLLLLPDAHPALARPAISATRPAGGGRQLAGYFDLPPSLRDELSAYLPARPGARIGPVPSAFGTWDFEILETAKGGAAQSLAEARPAILAALQLDGVESGEADVRDRQDQDRQLWEGLAQELLERRLLEAEVEAGAKTSGSGGPHSGPKKSLANGKLGWMRSYLHIRYIDLGKDS
jgi:hypothetical protein